MILEGADQLQVHVRSGALLPPASQSRKAVSAIFGGVNAGNRYVDFMGIRKGPIVELLVVTWVVAALCGCSALRPEGSPTPVGGLSPAASATTDAGLVAVALRDLPTDPGKFVATAAPVSGERARLAFPSGSEMEPIPETWSPDGTGAGGTMSVQVLVPGHEPTSYLAVMVRESDGWKVLATVEIEAVGGGR